MSEDKYAAIRAIPLRDALSMLGYSGWRKRSGKNEWFGKCPFHQPKKNNTSFSFTNEKFNCFSCGEHGSGAIDVVMKLKKIGFQEAVNLLGSASTTNSVSANKSGAVNVEQSPETPCLENKPFAGSYEKFYVKSEWLKARGLTEETLKLYGVGQYFNPSRKSLYSNKVLFPVRRFSDGVKTAYLARTIEQDSTDPKYIFPKGFHKQLELFGAWQLKQLALKTRAGAASGASASGASAQVPALPLRGAGLPLRLGFVVESPLCVMKFHQLGFQAVSPFGAFLSSEQVEIIRQLFRGVIYLPDRDKRDKVNDCVALLADKCWVKFPQFPADDPENLTQEQIVALLKSVVR